MCSPVIEIEQMARPVKFPEYNAVAEVDGNGFQQNGNPKNSVGLDRT